MSPAVERIDFYNPQVGKPTNLQNSAVLRMLEEEENRRTGRVGVKRVAWPPPQEGVLDPAEVVQPQQNAVHAQGGPHQYNQNSDLHQNQYSSQQAAPYQQHPTQPSYRPLKPLDVSSVGTGSPLNSPAVHHSPQAFRTSTPTKGWSHVQSPVTTPSGAGSQKYFGSPAAAQSYQPQPQSQPVSQPYQQSTPGYQQPSQKFQAQPYGGLTEKQYRQEPGRQYGPISPSHPTAPQTSHQFGSSPQSHQTPSQQYYQSHQEPGRQYGSGSQSYHQPAQQYQHPQQQYQTPSQQYQQPTYQQPSQQPTYQQPSQPSQQQYHSQQQYQPQEQYQPQQHHQSQQQYQPQQQYQSQQQYQPQQQYQTQQQYQPSQYQSSPSQQYQAQSFTQPAQPVAAQSQVAAPRSQTKYVEPPPSTITLRPAAPVSQAPAPVYSAQPATASLRVVVGGKNLRGDIKWPPEKVKSQMEEENRQRIELAKGPAFRPLRKEKDYTGFFAQHALNSTYPGYKIPPGTQFYRPEEYQ